MYVSGSVQRQRPHTRVGREDEEGEGSQGEGHEGEAREIGEEKAIGRHQFRLDIFVPLPTYI